jgi:hypothetical protein
MKNPDFPNLIATDNTAAHAVTFAGLSSPLWLHYLSDISQTILPIIGLGYWVYKATMYLYTSFRKKPDHDRTP